MLGFRRSLILLALALACPSSAASLAPAPRSFADPAEEFRRARSSAGEADSMAAADSIANPPPSGSRDADRFGPTSDPPWNPSRPVPSAESWETALRLPGRIVSLPLSALGYVARNGLIHVEESSLVPRVIYLLSLQQRIGLFATTASLGDRTGLGGALRAVPPPLGGHLLGELSASTGQYNRARIAAAAGPARLTYAYEWRSRDQFFGLGSAARENQASTYASRIQAVEASLGWSWAEAGGAHSEASAWIGPRDMVQRDGRDPRKQGVRERFPALAAGLLDTYVEHLIYGGRLVHDRRAGSPHWSRGWRLAVEGERFDRAIEAIAIRDAGTPAVQFTRYEVEAEAGVSFMRDPRTLRLAVRALNHEVRDGAGVFMLRDLARLGGSEGLAGFEPGRFHAADLLAAKLSYIFPLSKHLEFDLHVEGGNVFDHLGDARLDAIEHSYGVALRPRLETAPLGTIGVDWSDETLRVRYSFGGVE